MDDWRTLGLSRVPEVYAEMDFINAGVIGAEHPILTFGAGCFGLLDPSEFLFVAGHELGPIKSGHCLYR